MTGVAFITLLSAVSPTAIVAALLLLPKLCTCVGLLPSFSFCLFSSSLSTGNTSIPRRISSPRIRNTFSAAADATAAKGTKRPSMSFVPGETRRRGTAALRPSATAQEADTARQYDFTIVEVERGEDLLALALLIATLRDWLAICQSTTPVVWEVALVERHRDWGARSVR